MFRKWIRGNNYKDKCEICNSKYRLKFIPQYGNNQPLIFMIILILLIWEYNWMYLCMAFSKMSMSMNKIYIKNTLLYLPLILTHIKNKHLNSKKLLSYKLELIEP